MTEPLEELRRRLSGKGVLVDTNLLVLYIVGYYDQTFIRKFKRTSHYSRTHFATLQDLLGLFSAHRTTPHLLAEVSNYLGQAKDPARREFYEIFARLIEAVDEIHVPGRTVGSRPHFAQFGLTDLGMIEAAGEDQVVLTDDSRIADYMLRMGIEVIDFNHWKS